MERIALISAILLIAMIIISPSAGLNIIATANILSTTSTTSSTTSTSTSTSSSSTTTTILVCSGTPVITLSSNPTQITQDVNVVVSGLTNCNGVTIDIDSYNGCMPGDVLTSFVSGPTGGNVIITGQPYSGGYGQNPNGGNYGYWACVGNKASQASEAELVVLKPPKTTTTTIPVCSGTPVISLNPNPTKISQNVNVVVSGLSNCNGVTIDIDSYKGCTQSDILTSFVSGPTGGNVIITGQPYSGGYGQKPSGTYGYWACVNNKASQASEAILTVLPSATTSTTSTSTSTSITTSKSTTSASTTTKWTTAPTTTAHTTSTIHYTTTIKYGH